MKKIFSIKMRAAEGQSHEEGGKHISGAERIVCEEELKKTIISMYERAFHHSKGECDFFNLSFKEIKKEKIVLIPSLDISTIRVDNYIEGRKKAVEILTELGIEEQKANFVMHFLENVGELKGAAIIDINTLKRLDEPDKQGVRVTGMDWQKSIKLRLDEVLKKHGICNVHVKEAVCLASKVISAPGIISELCWSDDPDYTAGYVSTKDKGYVRITEMKEMGDEKGGRIFLFDSSQADFDECLKYLKEQVVLIDSVPKIR